MPDDRRDDPQHLPLTNEQLADMTKDGIGGGGLSSYWANRLLATLAARDAEITRLRDALGPLASYGEPARCGLCHRLVPTCDMELGDPPCLGAKARAALVVP